MSLRRYAAGTAWAVLAAATASAAYAQETTSAVHGTVTSGGAPVSGAAVVLLHTPSGTRATTSTQSSGNFDLRGLRVGGPYTVTITSAGQTKTLKGVFLQVTKTENIDIDLAEVEELVVTGTTTRNSDQGPKTVLSRQDIASVVSVARDPRDLARRDILVAQDLSGGRAGANASGISIAGSNPRFNRITVDGVSAQDQFGLAQGGLTTARGPVTLDAIEQFAVSAVPTDVENGDFQGGALNIVLRSGTNDLHGTAFVNYLNEGLVGKHISGLRVKQVISQHNYGGFLSGPLIKDKLFFAISYENYTTIDPTLFGVAGSGAPNAFANGLTQSTIDGVVNTFNTTYADKYSLGGIPLTAPVTDKKYSAKIDWNINDRHRASLTYRYASSSSIQRTDLGSTTATLFSHWYTQANRDDAVTAELHDNWTDQFSTTFKATYRDYRNGQNPPGGQNFADVQVCTAPVSDATTTSCAAGFSSVRFGPDQFRHANSLDEQEVRLQGLAEYTLNAHHFKLGVLARKAEVFDIFVPQSHGLYYFDSLADFNAGKASRLTYQNAISGNPRDAAFDSVYWTYSGFAQDTVDVTDDLRVSAGVRLETYNEPDRPTLNPNFTARNGYANTKTIDGLWLVMPRISADWKPKPGLKISGGAGLFAGGTPDVLTGTPFYNNGFQTNTIDIQRNASGLFSDANNTTGAGFTQAIGAAALNGLQGSSTVFVTPGSAVVAYQQGNVPGSTGVPPLSPVFALSPSFRLPGQWKTFVSVSYDLPDLWHGVTDGIRITGDLVTSEASHEISYYDSRSQPLLINGVQQFLPDGRIRYDGLSATTPGKTSTNLGGSNDIIVTNKNKGTSWTAGVTISKSWDFGLDASFGYARQNQDDLGPGLFFGTTAGSLYASVPAFLDPNSDYTGRSVYEIKNRYKMEVGYAHKFYKDNETRISLFGEHQDGRPFGFTSQDRQSGRSQVFGVTKTAQALFVPDFSAGPSATNPLRYGMVTFATPNDLALFRHYVDTFHIPAGLVQKYTNTNAPINRVDLQLSQEFPTLIEGHKLKVQVDIRNLLNMINHDWGLVGEYNDVNTLTRVDCADANGVAVASNSPTCVGYRYSQVPTTVTKTRNTALSLWYAQISLRYQF
ncbi:carboxypeptidase regulatory-like domain-containing protein [Phenylobacterium sp.]|uniref:TonB-dependent receptor n=1 Tax=Phenylobacterium sp. TaxID=1871053 RepID=UPI0025FEE009|nr:carboxypeptidase regulatory-like domain-containing protein [Phenylobacterium sp.]